MDLVFKKVAIPKIDTAAFIMNPIELKDFLEFEPKRIYYITNIKGATSAHAHYVEKEFFVMVAGSCVAEIDRGNGIEKISLQAPGDAVYVGNYVWHHFKNFARGSVLMAISSTNYRPDRSDYLEDYTQYQAELVKMKAKQKVLEQVIKESKKKGSL
jgi:mannose-6-phosphate isomerase-like protein (cupin superfamily)